MGEGSVVVPPLPTPTGARTSLPSVARTAARRRARRGASRRASLAPLSLVVARRLFAARVLLARLPAAPPSLAGVARCAPRSQRLRSASLRSSPPPLAARSARRFLRASPPPSVRGRLPLAPLRGRWRFRCAVLAGAVSSAWAPRSRPRRGCLRRPASPARLCCRICRGFGLRPRSSLLRPRGAQRPAATRPLRGRFFHAARRACPSGLRASGARCALLQPLPPRRGGLGVLKSSVYAARRYASLSLSASAYSRVTSGRSC